MGLEQRPTPEPEQVRIGLQIAGEKTQLGLGVEAQDHHEIHQDEEMPHEDVAENVETLESEESGKVDDSSDSKDFDTSETDGIELSNDYEPHESEEFGDSDCCLSVVEEIDPSGFGLEDHDGKREIHTLPDQINGSIRFFIDKNYLVHKLEPYRGAHDHLHEEVAKGIASHLKACNLKFCDRGDWIHIPAIGSNEALIELVCKNQSEDFRATLVNAMKDKSRIFRQSRIRLSNGDVVAVGALVFPAGSNDQTRIITKAALSRKYFDDPCTDQEIAGVHVDESMWQRFGETNGISKTNNRMINKTKQGLDL